MRTLPREANSAELRYWQEQARTLSLAQIAGDFLTSKEADQYLVDTDRVHDLNTRRNHFIECSGLPVRDELIQMDLCVDDLHALLTPSSSCGFTFCTRLTLSKYTCAMVGLFNRVPRLEVYVDPLRAA